VIRLFTKRSADPHKDLVAMLGGYELPSFRTTVVSTLRLLRDDNASSEQIAGQIELDPGLQMRVLRTVNAAAFGLSTKVSSVPHAINLLGRSRLEPLVLTVAVKDALPSGQIPGFDAGCFWHHSAVRAMAARGFARRLHPRTQEEAFAAGLLLDLAVPVLASAKGAEYVETYRSATDDPSASLVALERSSLGYDHTVAGQLEVEAGIRLAALLRDQDGPGDVDPIVTAASERYDVSPEDAVTIMQAAFEEAGHFSGLMA
jgi:HD-like signal output (HDOD) protein